MDEGRVWRWEREGSSISVSVILLYHVFWKTCNPAHTHLDLAHDFLMEGHVLLSELLSMFPSVSSTLSYIDLFRNDNSFCIFRSVIVSLYKGLSVHWPVCWSVHPSVRLSKTLFFRMRKHAYFQHWQIDRGRGWQGKGEGRARGWGVEGERGDGGGKGSDKGWRRVAEGMTKGEGRIRSLVWPNLLEEYATTTVNLYKSKMLFACSKKELSGALHLTKLLTVFTR